MNFITQHWSEILGVLGFILGAGHIIVKLTPSTKDDEIEAKIEEYLAKLGVKVPQQ